MTDAPLERVRSLGPPKPRLVGPVGRGRPADDDLRAWRFTVHRREARLEPPIDWREDPHGSRSWRYELHTLTWLRPVLELHAETGDRTALGAARDVVLDWARRHMGAGGGDSSEFAWYDMAVGLRAPYVAYVLRACLCEEMLAADEARLLLETAERHGRELADPGNYAAGNNHGLFQDEGLHLLAGQLPVLESASGWSELARERLWGTLQATVSFEEGAHLEHSSAYQFAILNMVERLAGNVDGLPELSELLRRLRRTAPWHVTPAGRLAQLGDTDDRPVPRWARDAAVRTHGLKALFAAGQAFVRDGDSYLAVTAAHHGRAHKHADDTGFLLMEGGRTILGDAGRWGYYEDEPDRRYARSNRAHNVLVVDGEDLDWRSSQPYGSGLAAAGEGDGWYALLLSNRLLAGKGVSHARLLLYRPASALLVVDSVTARRHRLYQRYFHFGAGFRAREIDGGVEVADGARSVTLVDGADGVSLELASGRDCPDRLGWTYPGDRERAPVWTAVLRAQARHATFTAAVALDGGRLRIAGCRLDPSRAELELEGGERISVSFARTLAKVDATAPPRPRAR